MPQDRSKLVKNLDLPTEGMPGGDTFIKRNALVNNELVPRRLHIPEDSGHADQGGLFFGQPYDGTLESADAFQADSAKYSMKSSGGNFEFKQQTKTILQYNQPAETLTLSQKTDFGKSVAFSENLQVQKNIEMSGSDSKIEWDDPNSDEKWQIHAADGKLQIEHSGAKEFISALSAGDKDRDGNDIIGSTDADALGLYPHYELLEDGSENTEVIEYKSFARTPPLPWAAGMSYNRLVHPAVEIGDEEVKLMSSVYVSGTLTVQEGTRSSFRDEADFSKNVYARKALEVGGVLHAKDESYFDKKVHVRGADGLSATHDVVAENVIARKELRSGNGNGFVAKNSGSITVAGDKFTVDSSQNFKVTAKGLILADGDVAGEGLKVTNHANLNSAETNALLTIKEHALLPDQKELRLGEDATKLYSSATGTARLEASSEAIISAPTASLRGGQAASVAVSEADGAVSASGASVSLGSTGAVSLTSAADALLNAQGGDAKLELKSGGQSALYSKENLAVTSDAALTVRGSTSLNLNGPAGVSVSAASGNVAVEAQTGEASLSYSGGKAEVKVSEEGTSGEGRVDISADHEVRLESSSGAIQLSSSTVGLTASDSMSVAAASGLTLGSSAGPVSLTATADSSMAVSSGKLDLESSAQLSARSTAGAVLLQGMSGSGGAKITLTDSVQVEAKAGSDIALQAEGGAIKSDKGEFQIMGDSSLHFKGDHTSANNPYVKTLAQLQALQYGQAFIDGNGFVKVRVPPGVLEYLEQSGGLPMTGGDAEGDGDIPAEVVLEAGLRLKALPTEELPESPPEGTVFYDTTRKTIVVWDGSAYVAPSSSSSSSSAPAPAPTSPSPSCIIAYPTEDDLPHAAQEGQFAFVVNRKDPVFFSGGVWYDFCCGDSRSVVKDRRMNEVFVVGVPASAGLQSDLLLTDFDSSDGSFTDLLSGSAYDASGTDELNAFLRDFYAEVVQIRITDNPSPDPEYTFSIHVKTLQAPTAELTTADQLSASVTGLTDQNYTMLEHYAILPSLSGQMPPVDNNIGLISMRTLVDADEPSGVTTSEHTAFSEFASDGQQGAQILLGMIDGGKTDQTIVWGAFDASGAAIPVGTYTLPAQTLEGEDILYVAGAGAVKAGVSVSATGLLTISKPVPPEGGGIEITYSAPGTSLHNPLSGSFQVHTFDSAEAKTTAELQQLVVDGYSGSDVFTVDGDYVYHDGTTFVYLDDGSLVLASDNTVELTIDWSSLGGTAHVESFPVYTYPHDITFALPATYSVAFAGASRDATVTSWQLSASIPAGVGVSATPEQGFVVTSADALKDVATEDGVAMRVTIVPNYEIRFTEGDKADLDAIVQNWDASSGLEATVKYFEFGGLEDYSGIFASLPADNAFPWEETANRWRLVSATDLSGMFVDSYGSLTDADMTAISSWWVPDGVISEIERIVTEYITFRDGTGVGDNTDVSFLSYAWAEMLSRLVETYSNLSFNITRVSDIYEKTARYLLGGTHMDGFQFGPIGTWQVLDEPSLEGLFGTRQDYIHSKMSTALAKLGSAAELQPLLAQKTAEFDEDISDWDVSGRNSFYRMFYGTQSFSRSLSPWWSKISARPADFTGSTDNGATLNALDVDFREMFAGAVAYSEVIPAASLFRHQGEERAKPYLYQDMLSGSQASVSVSDGSLFHGFDPAVHYLLTPVEGLTLFEHTDASLRTAVAVALAKRLEGGDIAAGAGDWTPALLSTTLWFDASDETTAGMLEDGSGNTSLQWRNKGFIPGSDPDDPPQPTISGVTFTEQLNGRRAASFDGNSIMRLASQIWTFRQVFIVAEWGGGGETFPSGKYSGLFTGGNRWNIIIVGEPGQNNIHGGTVGLSEINLNGIHSPFSNNANLDVFGAVLGGGIVGATANGPKTLDGFSIGLQSDFLDGSRGWVGKIAEVIAFSEIQTPADVRRIEGYLAHKWGLQTKLPTQQVFPLYSHVYSAQAPSAGMPDPDSHLNAGLGAMNSWGVSAVTDLSYLFYNCERFNSQIKDWDTSSVVKMRSTFQLARIFNREISGWSTGSVTTFHRLFSNANAFNQPIGGWHTGAVTDMQRVFFYASNFDQDISEWDTSSVVDISYGFYEARKFSQKLGNWDFSNVSTAKHIFRAATSFHGTDIYKWNVSSLRNAYEMFRCNFVGRIQSLDLDSTAEWAAGSYARCQVVQKSGVYYTVVVASTTEEPSDSSEEWEVVDAAEAAKGWDLTWNPNSEHIDVRRMFSYNPKFNQPLSKLNMKGITNLECMFLKAERFNSAVSGWDTSDCTNFKGVFDNAYAFNQPLTSWTTERATTMAEMFESAYAFNQSLDHFHVPRVTSFQQTFKEARAFDQDLSGWTKGADIDVLQTLSTEADSADSRVFVQNVHSDQATRQHMAVVSLKQPEDGTPSSFVTKIFTRVGVRGAWEESQSKTVAANSLTMSDVDVRFETSTVSSTKLCFVHYGARIDMHVLFETEWDAADVPYSSGSIVYQGEGDAKQFYKATRETSSDPSVSTDEWQVWSVPTDLVHEDILAVFSNIIPQALRMRYSRAHVQQTSWSLIFYSESYHYVLRKSGALDSASFTLTLAYSNDPRLIGTGTAFSSLVLEDALPQETITTTENNKQVIRHALNESKVRTHMWQFRGGENPKESAADVELMHQSVRMADRMFTLYERSWLPLVYPESSVSTPCAAGTILRRAAALTQVQSSGLPTPTGGASVSSGPLGTTTLIRPVGSAETAGFTFSLGNGTTIQFPDGTRTELLLRGIMAGPYSAEEDRPDSIHLKFRFRNTSSGALYEQLYDVSDVLQESGTDLRLPLRAPLSDTDSYDEVTMYIAEANTAVSFVVGAEPMVSIRTRPVSEEYIESDGSVNLSGYPSALFDPTRQVPLNALRVHSTGGIRRLYKAQLQASALPSESLDLWEVATSSNSYLQFPKNKADGGNTVDALGSLSLQDLSNIQYTAGDLIQCDGVFYTAKADITLASYEPQNRPTRWQEVDVRQNGSTHTEYLLTAFHHFVVSGSFEEFVLCSTDSPPAHFLENTLERQTRANILVRSAQDLANWRKFCEKINPTSRFRVDTNVEGVFIHTINADSDVDLLQLTSFAFVNNSAPDRYFRIKESKTQIRHERVSTKQEHVIHDPTEVFHPVDQSFDSVFEWDHQFEKASIYLTGNSDGKFFILALRDFLEIREERPAKWSHRKDMPQHSIINAPREVRYRVLAENASTGVRDRDLVFASTHMYNPDMYLLGEDGQLQCIRVTMYNTFSAKNMKEMFHGAKNFTNSFNSLTFYYETDEDNNPGVYTKITVRRNSAGQYYYENASEEEVIIDTNKLGYRVGGANTDLILRVPDEVMNPRGGISNFDTLYVTNMNSAFKNAQRLFVDLSAWNVSDVTDSANFRDDTHNHITPPGFSMYNRSSRQDLLQAMYHRLKYPDSYADTYGEIDQWNISSSITDLSFLTDIPTLRVAAGMEAGPDAEMSANLAAFNADLSDWRVSQVNDFTAMLKGASSFTNGVTDQTKNRLSERWALKDGATLASMFEGCSVYFDNITPWMPDAWGEADWTNINLGAPYVFWKPDPVNSIGFVPAENGKIQVSWVHTPPFPQTAATSYDIDIVDMNPEEGANPIVSSNHNVTPDQNPVISNEAIPMGNYRIQITARVKVTHAGTHNLASGVKVSDEFAVTDAGGGDVFQVTTPTYTKLFTKDQTISLQWTYRLRESVSLSTGEQQPVELEESNITIATDAPLPNVFGPSIDFNSGSHYSYVHLNTASGTIDLRVYEQSSGQLKHTKVLVQEGAVQNRLLDFDTAIRRDEANSKIYVLVKDALTATLYVFADGQSEPQAEHAVGNLSVYSSSQSALALGRIMNLSISDVNFSIVGEYGLLSVVKIFAYTDAGVDASAPVILDSVSLAQLFPVAGNQKRIAVLNTDNIVSQFEESNGSWTEMAEESSASLQVDKTVLTVHYTSTSSVRIGTVNGPIDFNFV